MFASDTKVIDVISSQSVTLRYLSLSVGLLLLTIIVMTLL